MSGAKDFIHLHLHTEYSLLDGASRPSEVAKRAAEWGMSAVALTDHGNMYGTMPFYQSCKAAGVKPILGVEGYVITEGTRLEKTRVKREDGKGLCHFTLLCENETGYRNVLKMVSDSWLNGFYYKPRMDRELLRAHSEGLIAMSGCLGGEIPQALLHDDIKRAERVAYEFQEIFGAGNFYLELQDHHTAEQTKVNLGMYELHRLTGIPLVATNDVHYVEESDAGPQDLLLCIQTGCLHADENRMRMSSRELFMRSGEQMWQLFGEVPDALTNTMAIAERCNVSLRTGDLILPEFPKLPPGESAGEYLRRLCYERLPRFYDASSQDVRDRLEYELKVIEDKGYSAYMLIVWDLIDYAKSRGIRVGPGRGSAAGSLVAYVLGITELDPLKYALFFERFLNPERPSAPDIDIDFPPERREEMVAYTIEQYGATRTAKIITFGTMGAKAAIKDVGRVLEMPINEVNELTAMVPDKPGTSIKEALEGSEELRRRYETDERVNTIIGNALRLEGMARHTSIHAAAMVIGPDDLSNYVPLCRVSGGEDVVTQFDMGAIEKCGLLKMDFLGLRTMTVIDEACRLIARNHNLPGFDVRDLPLDDKRTYDLISRGDVVGVFQLESGGFQKVCKEMRPDRIEDIVALVALYRPGPMDNIPDYIARKHGQRQVVFKHPMLEPILQETYGIIVYQEQVMQIGRDLGGFTLAGADAIRKAVGKKDAAVMAKVRTDFVAGAAKQGISEKLSNELMDEIEAFARYAFNKAHSACYAVVSYWTAYLKANYPREFMAAQLTSVMDHREKVVAFINDTRAVGIEVLPPCVNTGGEVFEVQGDHIVYGLAGINGIGAKVAQAIVEERQGGGRYADLYDFLCRVDLKMVPKGALEKLIKAGACREFGNRKELMLSYEAIWDAAQRTQADQRSGQISLFDGLDDSSSADLLVPPVKKTAEYSKEELRQMDTELLGLVVFEDPYAELRRQLAELEVAASAVLTTEIDSLANDTQIIMAGLLDEQRTFNTRRGEASRARLTDLNGSTTVLLWSGQHDSYQHLCSGAEVRVVVGKVRRQEDRPGPPDLVVDQILRPSEWRRKRTKPARPEQLGSAPSSSPSTPEAVEPDEDEGADEPMRMATPSIAASGANGGASGGANGDGNGKPNGYPTAPTNGGPGPKHDEATAPPPPRAVPPTAPPPPATTRIERLRVEVQVTTGELEESDLQQRLRRLASTLRDHPGQHPVEICLRDGQEVRRLMLTSEMAANWSDSLESAIKRLEGCRLSPAN